jgi:hypothetical protein
VQRYLHIIGKRTKARCPSCDAVEGDIHHPGCTRLRPGFCSTGNITRTV